MPLRNRNKMQDRSSSGTRCNGKAACLFIIPLLFLLGTRINLPLHSSHPDTATTTELLGALRAREAKYQVLSDKVVYDRYARVYSRKVQFPDGKQFDFDVWGRVWKNDSFGVVTVIPFDRETRTFTLIREYNIAHARFSYVFPTGQMERAKHASNEAAAAAELEEEAQLRCNHWSNLLGGDEGRGAPQDKYQREVVFYYLCTDAEHVDDAAAVDEEEDIEVVHGITSKQLRELVAAGAMQSNQIAAAYLALDRLRSLHLLSCSA